MTLASLRAIHDGTHVPEPDWENWAHEHPDKADLIDLLWLTIRGPEWIMELEEAAKPAGKREHPMARINQLAMAAQRMWLDLRAFRRERMGQ